MLGEVCNRKSTIQGQPAGEHAPGGEYCGKPHPATAVSLQGPSCNAKTVLATRFKCVPTFAYLTSLTLAYLGCTSFEIHMRDNSILLDSSCEVSPMSNALNGRRVRHHVQPAPNTCSTCSGAALKRAAYYHHHLIDDQVHNLKLQILSIDAAASNSRAANHKTRTDEQTNGT